jgi:hypothetical protein
MVNLWRAVCFLSVNPDVFDQCQAAVKGTGIEIVKRTPPCYRPQPTNTAIDELNDILNVQNKLRLGLYELAEINRWLQQDTLKANLTAYKNAMALDSGTKTEILELAGALLYDPEFLTDLVSSTTPGDLLRRNGFTVTDAEAGDIQGRIEQNPAQTAAKEFVSLLWSGSVCLGRLKFYGSYSHTNY